MSCTIVETSDEQVQALQLLLTGFAEGNLEKVRSALNTLTDSNQTDLHEQICDMTNKFHQSINTFKSRLDPAQITMTTTNIPDAAKKLEYVLQATNDATMNLFSFVERIEEGIKQSEEGMNAVEHSGKPVSEFLSEQRDRLKESKRILQEMIMAQEYQDLCGQALSKVLKLVREVEGTLRDLIKQFGIETQNSEGVQSPDDTKYDQNEADALLKELGF